MVFVKRNKNSLAFN